MSDITEVKWEIMHQRSWGEYESMGYTLIAQMGDYDIVAKGEYPCDADSEEEYECLLRIVDLHNRLVEKDAGISLSFQ